jgi:hypothetical protein
MQIKKINNYTYSLSANDADDDNAVEMLYSSILLFAPHGYHDKLKSSIFITCETIQLLPNYLNNNENLLTYEQCLNIINTISIQINYLIKHGYGFYAIDINDVLVINNNTFVVSNCDKLLKVNNHKQEPKTLQIYKFINKNSLFHNPEIMSINELPCEINHKCIYYSLALLIKYCLFGDVEHDLEPISNTKLFYFLERCLMDDPDSREMIYI